MTDKKTAAFSLNRKKLRTARRREGRHLLCTNVTDLLRTNLTDDDPALATARSALEKCAAVQMIDVHLATTNSLQSAKTG